MCISTQNTFKTFGDSIENVFDFIQLNIDIFSIIVLILKALDKSLLCDQYLYLTSSYFGQVRSVRHIIETLYISVKSVKSQMQLQMHGGMTFNIKGSQNAIPVTAVCEPERLT